MTKPSTIRLAAAVLAALTLVTHAGAQAAAKAHKVKAHGALALDRNSDAWGYGVNFKTSREARLESLKQCNRPTCEVVMRIEGECGAVARAKASAAKFSSARGANRAEAETKALRQCGKDCQLAGWACNR